MRQATVRLLVFVDGSDNRPIARKLMVRSTLGSSHWVAAMLIAAPEAEGG